MKSLGAILLLFTIALGACNSNNRKAEAGDIENSATSDNPESKGPKGTPDFVKTEHNFGDIIDGERVFETFRFKNTGKGDLVISDVHTSCGCTTPEWTRDIIPPGGEGMVKIEFNSTERSGLNEKSVPVSFSNSTVNEVVLKFKANVIKK